MADKKSNRGYFFLVLIVSCGLSVMEALITFGWFRAPEVSLEALLPIVAAIGLAFAAAAFLLIGRLLPVFDQDFAALQAKPEDYERELKRLGGAPLRGMILFLVLLIAFTAALGALRIAFPFREGAAGAGLLLFFALGMGSAAFVFVLFDALTTGVLIRNKLESYPPTLRDSRQARKTFIIPMFMAIMALLFGGSLCYLVLNKAGGDLAKVPVQSGLGAGATTILYLILIATLVRVWNKTTGRIYQSIISQLDILNSADKDLRGRISITSVDELGTIAGLTNQFCSTLENNIRDLKRIQGELIRTGSELQLQSEQSGAAVEQITGGISQLKGRSEDQSASIDESTVAVREIVKNIESLDGMISRQSGSVSEASTAVEEMVGNIASINTSIERMANEFNRLTGDARSGSDLQKTAGPKIQAIVERSLSLQEANKVIANIASQTNLLAMNAAIEAAHAGDAGRGFSVVADEIRVLADTSSKESRKIKTEIQSVQSSIQEVVAVSRDSEGAFSGIAERIDAVGNLVRELHAAIAEQHEGAQQILAALRIMNDVTLQVRSGSQEMNSGSAIIAGEMEKLLSASREVSSRMAEMTASVGHVAESSRRVNSIAAETKGAIAGMDGVVSGFKTN